MRISLLYRVFPLAALLIIMGVLCSFKLGSNFYRVCERKKTKMGAIRTGLKCLQFTYSEASAVHIGPKF